jgi:hypothetical protein
MAFDTSARMAAVHNRLYRQLGGSGRARIAAELSDALRDLATAGVRQRHPEYDEEQVLSAVLAVFYGSRLSRL